MNRSRAAAWALAVAMLIAAAESPAESMPAKADRPILDAQRLDVGAARRLAALIRLFAREGELRGAGVSLRVPGDDTLVYRFDRLRWRWQRDERRRGGRILIEGRGIRAPGGVIDLAFEATVRPRAQSLAVDVEIAPIACAKLVAAAPPDWLEPLGAIAVDGEIAPWLEFRMRGDRQPVWEIRQANMAGCRVVGVETLPGADWLVGDRLAGLNQPFSILLGSRALGPATSTYHRLDALPEYVGAAMYLSEEPGFFESGGYDPKLLALAARTNLQAGELVAGGSSITQQLVKNLFLSGERTFERKVQELVLAAAVAEVVSKERILEIYVNIIELGPDVWGIHAAARHYFDKEPAALTPVEAAFLAAIKPSPMQGERARQTGDLTALQPAMESILRSMQRAGYLESQHRVAADELRF